MTGQSQNTGAQSTAGVGTPKNAPSEQKPGAPGEEKRNDVQREQREQEDRKDNAGKSNV